MLRDKLNSMILTLAFLAFAVKGLPPSILWYPIRLFTVWNRFNYMILYQYLLWQIWVFFIIAVSDSAIYDFSTYLEDGFPHLSLQIIGHWSRCKPWLNQRDSVSFYVTSPLIGGWVGRLDFFGRFFGRWPFFSMGIFLGRWLWDLWPCCSVPLRWGSNGNDDCGSRVFFSKCFKSYTVRPAIS